MDHQFRIPVGDWSSDGHGQCDWFTVNCSHPLNEVREAYFKAIEVLGKEWPTYICSAYEYSWVDKEDEEELTKLGFDVTTFEERYARGDGEEELWHPTSEGMLELTLWFIQQGDVEIQFEIVPTQQAMFPFYGYDDEGRHISATGYGIFPA